MFWCCTHCCAICVLFKSEYLLFVYIVLWGISDASEENLYISSVGLDGVYFSSFLEKTFALIPTPQISRAAAYCDPDCPAL